MNDQFEWKFRPILLKSSRLYALFQLTTSLQYSNDFSLESQKAVAAYCWIFYIGTLAAVEVFKKFGDSNGASKRKLKAIN